MVSAATTTAILAVIIPFSAAFIPSNTVRTSGISLASYLDSLTGATPGEAAYAPPVAFQQPSAPVPTASESSSSASTGFYHVPFEYFHFGNLASKGPRATCDWGTPQDWSRKLADDGVSCCCYSCLFLSPSFLARSSYIALMIIYP